MPRLVLPALRPFFVAGVTLVGVGAGLATFSTRSSSPACGATWGALSDVMGWTYFAAWSLSFYPQCVLNWERRSVVGLSFDYVLLNVVGFACYSSFTCALFFSPELREEYERAHAGHAPAVRVDDVFFALHALLLSCVTLVQICMYDRGQQVVSLHCKLGLCALGIALPAGIVAVASGLCSSCTWLGLLYVTSYVKLAVTLLKYPSQAVLNCRRRSTRGWNIDNVVLDFTGGVLSLAQLLLDAACSSDWSAVAGDPVKFGLGATSIVFDVIFLVQHFGLYRHARGDAIACGATRAASDGAGGDGSDGASGLAPAPRAGDADGREAPLLVWSAPDSESSLAAPGSKV